MEKSFCLSVISAEIEWWKRGGVVFSMKSNAIKAFKGGQCSTAQEELATQATCPYSETYAGIRLHKGKSTDG